MARRSAWEHLKPEIEAEFQNGKQPSDLYAQYPSVPPRTIRDWFGKCFPPNSPANSPDRSEAQSVSVEVLSPRSNLVSIDGKEQQSDIAVARKTLRAIAKGADDAPPAVQVQAALGLIRLAELRYKVPKHILDEVEESKLNDERDRVRELPPEEIARRIREALG